MILAPAQQTVNRPYRSGLGGAPRLCCDVRAPKRNSFNPCYARTLIDMTGDGWGFCVLGFFGRVSMDANQWGRDCAALLLDERSTRNCIESVGGVWLLYRLREFVHRKQKKKKMYTRTHNKLRKTNRLHLDRTSDHRSHHQHHNWRQAHWLGHTHTHTTVTQCVRACVCSITHTSKHRHMDQT